VVAGLIGNKNDLCTPIVIMSYPVYCRYRAMMRRLEGSSDAFFNSILVMAIGGFTTLKAGMRVMFCRLEFEFSDLEELEIHREDLGEWLTAFSFQPSCHKYQVQSDLC
jgi:hypothetical protein